MRLGCKQPQPGAHSGLIKIPLTGKSLGYQWRLAVGSSMVRACLLVCVSLSDTDELQSTSWAVKQGNAKQYAGQAKASVARCGAGVAGGLSVVLHSELLIG